MADSSNGVAQQPRNQILQAAANMINGDRAQEYGDATESFARIAVLWSALLDVDITPGDVAKCMVALKLSRLTETSDHTDSWVDIAGYAALGFEVSTRSSTPSAPRSAPSPAPVPSEPAKAPTPAPAPTQTPPQATRGPLPTPATAPVSAQGSIRQVNVPTTPSSGGSGV